MNKLKLTILLSFLSFSFTTPRGVILCSITDPIRELINKDIATAKINNDEIRAFVSKHWDASKYIYLTQGVPMAVSLSQWILESGYASDPLARKRHNLGGIMSYKGGKKHLKHFKSYEDFYIGYSNIFKQECYRSLQPRGLELWIKSLTWPCCSYARSDDYEQKLWRIIKLYEFDCLPN